MFCPLCNAEYRDGFTQCSDCKMPLVQSLEEARSQSVCVWKGNSERKLDTVLDALAAESIPYHYREGLSPIPKLTLSHVPVRPRFETEVWVLHDDLARAEAVIRDLNRDPEQEENGEPKLESQGATKFCPLCNAEYCQGIADCSDCKVPLVGSLAEAQRSSAMAWKGSSQGELDRVLRALDDEGIPSHHKELINAQPRVNVLGFDLIERKPMFEYEVWVFRADVERARAAIAAVPKRWFDLA